MCTRRSARPSLLRELACHVSVMDAVESGVTKQWGFACLYLLEAVRIKSSSIVNILNRVQPMIELPSAPNTLGHASDHGAEVAQHSYVSLVLKQPILEHQSAPKLLDSPSEHGAEIAQ